VYLEGCRTKEVHLIPNMREQKIKTLASIYKGDYKISAPVSFSQPFVKSLMLDLRQLKALDPSRPAEVLEFFQFRAQEFTGTASKDLTCCLYHPSPVGLAVQTTCNKLAEGMLKKLKEHHSHRVKANDIFQALLYMGVMRGSLTDVVKACELLMCAGREKEDGKKVWVGKDSEQGPDIYEEVESMKDLYEVDMEKTGYSISKTITGNPAFRLPSVKRVGLSPDDRKEQLDFIMKETSLRANDHERIIVFTKHDDDQYYICEFLYKLETTPESKKAGFDAYLRLCQIRQVKLLNKEKFEKRLNCQKIAILEEDCFLLMNYKGDNGYCSECTAFDRKTLQFDKELSEKYKNYYIG